MTDRVLYGYFRSSAAYRVRIALNFKGLDYHYQPVNLLKGEQRSPAYLAINPQGLVPLLDDGGVRIAQSLAICEYLDEAYPDTPRLLPADPAARARVRSLALAIAADIHPLQNTRVGKYLQTEYGKDEEGKAEWIRHWIRTGFDALENSWPSRRAGMRQAMRRRWPMSACCRRCSAPVVSAWIWRRIRTSSASRKRLSICKRLPRRIRRGSRTRCKP